MKNSWFWLSAAFVVATMGGEVLGAPTPPPPPPPPPFEQNGGPSHIATAKFSEEHRVPTAVRALTKNLNAALRTPDKDELQRFLDSLPTEHISAVTKLKELFDTFIAAHPPTKFADPLQQSTTATTENPATTTPKNETTEASSAVADQTFLRGAGFAPDAINEALAEKNTPEALAKRAAAFVDLENKKTTPKIRTAEASSKQNGTTVPTETPAAPLPQPTVHQNRSTLKPPIPERPANLPSPSVAELKKKFAAQPTSAPSTTPSFVRGAKGSQSFNHHGSRPTFVANPSVKSETVYPPLTGRAHEF